jgi:WD40 repeat protein
MSSYNKISFNKGSKRIWLTILVSLLIFVTSILALSQIASPRDIVLSSGYAYAAGWLREGSQLAIVNHNSVIVVAIGAAGTPVTIESTWNLTGTDIFCPVLSPDSNSVVYQERGPWFATTSNGNYQRVTSLYSLTKTQLTPTLIMTSTSYLDCPSWSPDNQHVLMSVSQENGHVLRIVDVVNSTFRDVFTDFPEVYQGTWSPDGKFIALEGQASTDYRFFIKIVQADTGEPLETGLDTIVGTSPSWSPNGQYLAYIDSQPGTDGNLVAVKLDGTDKRTLVDIQNLDYRVGVPLWSPRGDYIATRYIAKSGIGPSIADSLGEIVLIPVPEDLRQGATK